MSKIRQFFQNKVVMIIEAIVMVLGTVGLTIGGVSLDTIEGLSSVAVAALIAIDAVITFIAAIVPKKGD